MHANYTMEEIPIPASPEEQLRADSCFFKGMLDLVPTQFYFSQEKLAALSEKGKRKLEDSEQGKQNHKKTKFDPQQLATVSQIQEVLAEKEDEEEQKMMKKKKKKKNKQQSEVPSLDLQQRLQSKIESLKGTRKAKNESAADKKLKRLERRKKKRQKAKQNKEKAAGNQTQNGEPKGKAGKGVQKPIYNKEGKMVFSKFDFTGSEDKRTKSDIPTGKNYKKLLEKVTKKNEKLKKLQETDKNAAKLESDKYNWQVAMKKAEGVKVKDNPELLKKSMKRQEKLKKKNVKAWQDRTQQVEQRIKDRQDKRQKNIQARKTAKMDKKIKKAKKKGRMVPGF